MITNNLKRCFYCKEEKAIESFTRSNYSVDGLQSGCRPCKATIQRELRKKYPEKAYATGLKSDLKRKYGLTENDYNRMFQIQGGKCAICGTHQASLKSKLCVDHNHTTGKVRALLCAGCNTSLGHYEKRKELCEEYLRKYL